MKKQVLISLLSVIPIVVSCTTDADDIIDQVNVEESVNEVEVTEVVVVDLNPFELNDNLISQRNALLEMTNNTSNLNWSTDIEMKDWDNIEIDSNGNIIFLETDSSFVNVEDKLEALVYLNSLIINEHSIIAENGLNLPNLETLVITNSFLIFMPNWILETKSLKSIRYSESKLESIPDEIDQLINLEYLTVEDGTPLARVSPNLADLLNLISIDFSLVSSNGLISVPSEVCNLVDSRVEVLLPSGTDCN